MVNSRQDAHPHSSSCYSCGLDDPHITYTSRTPILPIDYSKNTSEAYHAARCVAEEAEGKIIELNKAIERLTFWRDGLAIVPREHRSNLAPINSLPDDVLLLVLEYLTGWDNNEFAWAGAPW